MRVFKKAFVLLTVLLVTTAVGAVEITITTGSVGGEVQALRDVVKGFERETGHVVTVMPMPNSSSEQFAQYRLWLAAGNKDVDVYLLDVIWAPQLAEQFLDLSKAAAKVIGKYIPATVESQTVNGRLVAMPLFTDAPALYYRKDLLAKYKEKTPTTWRDLTAIAKRIQRAERRAGRSDMWGYVWQGSAYEGLTCNALEWIKSYGGGQIVEADGRISVNNRKAVAALKEAASWVGTISPEGVLSYTEEESRGVWQTGNAVFMRNWPYAFSLGNGENSPVRGKFGVMPLPSSSSRNTSAATLGGWNLGVSKFSEYPKEATDLVLFLASKKVQKERAIREAKLPTIISLYDDAEIEAAQPIVTRWKDVMLNAVPRPSAPTKKDYNEVSSKFWTAVHETLSGEGSASDNLELLEIELEELKGSSW